MSRKGFTLLELLVSLVILMMIVMMIAGVFTQMRVAWGTGMRRSKLNMEGRAAADFIARELSHAVADEKLPCVIVDDAPSISFYMLGDSTPSNRTVYYVTYAGNGSEITRRVDKVYMGKYPQTVPGSAATLAQNVKEVRFFTPDGQDYGTNLPAWVDLRLILHFEERVARFRVGSSGRDRKWNTDDDIWSDDP